MTTKGIRYVLYCVPALIGAAIFFFEATAMWARNRMLWFFIVAIAADLVLLSAILFYEKITWPKNLSVTGEMRIERRSKPLK